MVEGRLSVLIELSPEGNGSWKARVSGRGYLLEHGGFAIYRTAASWALDQYRNILAETEGDQ